MSILVLDASGDLKQVECEVLERVRLGRVAGLVVYKSLVVDSDGVCRLITTADQPEVLIMEGDI